MDNRINNFSYNNWNYDKYKDFINYLLSLRDSKYKQFQSKLIPNNKYKMIGIRIPLLRQIANKINSNEYEKYITLASSEYFEEVMLKSIIISKIKDKNKQIKHIKKLIPTLNNWCLCDTFCSSMKCVKNNLEFYFDFFSSYKNRISIVILLNYYLCDEYIDRVFDYIKQINSNDYYINMAISWLLCEAYVKYKNKVLNYLNICNNEKIIKMTNSKIHDSKKIKER